MDFNDTPEEAAFRAEVRAWLDANATKTTTAATARKATALAGRRQGLAGQEGRRRLRRASPGRRSTAAAAASPILQVIYQPGGSELPGAAGLFDIGLGMCIPTMMAYRRRPSINERYVAAGAARRGGLVPALLRAGRRLRRRRRPHQRGRARRRRLGDQRPEGLDLGRALLATTASSSPAPIPTCPSTRASRCSSCRHEDAGRRGAADQADVGRRELQRGVLHRRAHPRQPAAGRGGRGLEGRAHHADERAAGGRAAVGRARRRRADGARARSPSSRTAPAISNQRCASKIADWYVAAPGPEAHPLPHPDGAVERARRRARNARSSRSSPRPRCRTWAPSPWS